MASGLTNVKYCIKLDITISEQTEIQFTKEINMFPKDSENLAEGCSWIDLKAAAAFLGKPPSWIYDNVHRLEIPHVRLERQYRFRATDLNAWLENRMWYSPLQAHGDAA